LGDEENQCCDREVEDAWNFVNSEAESWGEGRKDGSMHNQINNCIKKHIMSWRRHNRLNWHFPFKRDVIFFFFRQAE